MDEYIKRKLQKPLIEQDVKKPDDRDLIRELREEIGIIFEKIVECEFRSERLKEKLREVELRSLVIGEKDNGVLGAPSMEKPSVKNILSDGKTEAANHNLEENTKLGITERVVDERSADATSIIKDTDDSEKLQESGNRTLKSRKIRKKF